MKQHYSFIFVTAIGVVCMTVLLLLIGTGKFDAWMSQSYVDSSKEVISQQPVQTETADADDVRESSNGISDEEKITRRINQAYEDVTDTVEEFLPGVVCIGTKENMYIDDEMVTYPFVLETSISQYVEDTFDLNRLIDEEYKDVLQMEHLNVWIPVEIVTLDEENPYTNYFPILCVWDADTETVDALIQQQEEILSQQTGQSDRFLVLGFIGEMSKKQRRMETELEKKYGNQFINVRSYMVGLQDITSKDETNDENISEEWMADETHLNEEGYKLLGHLIYERMWDLGYFDEIDESFKINMTIQ